MKLFKAKVWSVMDIGMLKWSSLLVGMIAGAYLADFIKSHVWYVAGVAILLAIKPTLSYFRND